MTTSDPTVSTIILAQLGGRMFCLMTGARDFVYDSASLTCKLGRGAKGTHLRITLDASDTYTVETLRIRGATVTTVAEASMVYVDNLRDVVESQTGFYLSMGAMR